MNTRKKMGEILIEAGVLTESTLQRALSLQKTSGKRLGQVLEEMGKISEEDLAGVLARQFNLKLVGNLSGCTVPREVLDLVDPETALEKYVFPLKRERNSLSLALANPLDMPTMDGLSFRTGLKVLPFVSTKTEIHRAIRTHYFAGEEEERGSQWRILVADDQEFFRTLITDTLERQGYNIFPACDGAEAVRLARRHAPHLILMDTLMPRVSGWEAFKTLKSSPVTRSIPVIAFTCRASAEEEAALLESGYFDFVAKPFNPVRLSARVKHALKLVYGKRALPGRTFSAPPVRPAMAATGSLRVM